MEEISAASKKLASQALADDYSPLDLEPKHVKEQRIGIEIQSEINSLVANLNNSISQLENSLKKHNLNNEDTFLAIKKIKEQSDFIKDHFDEFLMKLDRGILSFADEMQIKEETLARLYTAAKTLYDENQYKEAALAFNLLAILEPDQISFWEGLGHAEFLAQNYENALIAFLETSSRDPQNPIHDLMAAKCYEELKEFQKALDALDQINQKLGPEPAFNDFKDQIQAIKEEIFAKIQH